jgi:hypothetical protein
MTRLGRQVFAWLALAGLTSSVAGQSCEPPPLSKEELRDPIVAYVAYWASIFEEAARSGIPSPISVFSTEHLTEVTKRCDAVVRAATDRESIQTSAKLVLRAYAYVCDNIGLAKEQRKQPEDADVAALLGNPANGLTEGALTKCFLIAHVRFLAAAGVETLITEKQIRDRPDFDFEMLGKAAPEPAADMKDVDDVTLHIAGDGAIKLDGKAVPHDGLDKSLNALVKRAEQRKHKLLITLQTDEQAKYARIVEVMNALAKAGIGNVSFTVGTDEL